ncbi:TIGR03767 family metallophosphoesterase [Streptomyces sp. RKAG293]|uniref:TIGR03767 family metallophosphoesterase n=1 Tax=Streptomyces sp. RKAG293 TaxID=2893403 RepID=UPI002033D332|nr:TIGR03767 family metallophosphoesterase [Streptomyces sp. RKAG293]MCM2416619.1 TIGR03767 family metallophosphoesterase [Streptomyces sp. RKAG293]
MTLTRRNLLFAGAAGVVASAIGLRGFSGTADAATALRAAADVGGLTAPTTLDQTVLPGVPNSLGYRKLTMGAGEPFLVRTMGSVPTAPAVDLALLAFGHMTDMQVVDDQSPGRTEFLDRLADLPNSQDYPTDSAYRPQEFLSTHLVDAMCRSLRQIGRGPRTTLPMALTLVTGDMVDNCQYNETRWYIGLLDGGYDLRADSGQIGLEQSVSNLFGGPSGTVHDPSYWYPQAGRDPNGIADQYQMLYGFPAVPGLLAAARVPYTTTGLGMPWYAAMGNHDGEIQGNYPVHPGGLVGCIVDDISGYATGSRKPDGSASVKEFPADPGPGDINELISEFTFGTVVADPDRRMLDAAEFRAEHRKTSGLPVGHGFTSDLPAGYYTIPSDVTDLIQFIALDTVNYDGNAGGRMPNTQLQWLESKLKANSSKYIADDHKSVVTQSGVKDKLFVLFCHHTIDSINNSSGDIVGNNYAYRDQIEVLLQRYPNVVLVVNGHTHRNGIKAHMRGVKQDYADLVTGLPGGFWEINTASHIDWPSQSRIIEMAAGSDKTLSIFTTIVDIDAPLSNGGDLSNPKALAALARELAVNDPTERASARRGTASDRNTQLVLPAPFTIAMPKPVGNAVFVQASTGQLWDGQAGGTGKNLAQAMAPHTSPASASPAESGPPITVFQSAANSLVMIDQLGKATDLRQPMKAGTSPSIAMARTGQVLIAVQSGSGTLTTVDVAGVVHNLGLPVAVGSSPVVSASYANVAEFTIVFRHTDGTIWKVPPTGPPSSTGFQVAQNTNPAICPLLSGGHMMAFHGSSSGTLWVVGPDGAPKNLQVPLAAGTSPAIAAATVAATGGPVVAAVHHIDGSLYRVDARTGAATKLGVTYAPGTSPAVIAAAAGFGGNFYSQGSDGSLRNVNPLDTVTNVSLGMAPGTSPGASYSFSGLYGQGMALATIPNVVGMAQADAAALLAGAGRAMFASVQKNCNGTEGIVTSQNPTAGVQLVFPTQPVNVVVTTHQGCGTVPR